MPCPMGLVPCPQQPSLDPGPDHLGALLEAVGGCAPIAGSGLPLEVRQERPRAPQNGVRRVTAILGDERLRVERLTRSCPAVTRILACGGALRKSVMSSRG